MQASGCNQQLHCPLLATPKEGIDSLPKIPVAEGQADYWSELLACLKKAPSKAKSAPVLKDTEVDLRGCYVDRTNTHTKTAMPRL